MLNRKAKKDDVPAADGEADDRAAALNHVLALDPVAAVWDLAAMQIIVEEAGGRFSDLGGETRIDGGDAIATNGLVHDAALGIIGRR